MEFRIALQHSMDGAGYISAVAKLYGIIVDDVKESEIVDTDTNKVLGQVYILCCFGSVENFEKLKKDYFSSEIEYEGFRTIM